MALVVSEIENLSIYVQLAIALNCYEYICAKSNVDKSIVEQFIQHMWIVPTIVTGSEWEEWDGRDHHPYLVGAGLGYGYEDGKEAVMQALDESGVSEPTFLYWTTCVVEIVYINLHAAVDTHKSARFTAHLVEEAQKQGAELPSMDLFKELTLKYTNSWGCAVSRDECDAWMNWLPGY